MRIVILLLVSLLTPVALAQSVTDNAKLTELFNVDQAARQTKNIDWAKLRTEDDERRKEVHRMLDAGEVQTGNDYFHAALIYQHGQRHEDFLLAHILSVDAISLGNKNARWLAAATLDRYLLAISQPQIFGTQFESNPEKHESWTHRTIDPALLSDSMRLASCVAPIDQQEKNLEEVKHGGALRSTNVTDCK